MRSGLGMTSRPIDEEVVRQLKRMAQGQRPATPASMMTIDHDYAEAERRRRELADGALTKAEGSAARNETPAEVRDPAASLPAAPYLDEEIAIDLAPAALKGRVVWTNGSECGVAFDREMDGYSLMSRMAAGVRADAPSKPGPAPRLPVKPDTDGSFRPGLRIKVVQSGGRERNAIVNWTRDHFAGLVLED